MALNTGNKIPLYQQIKQNLKQRVKMGVYNEGSSLPSLRVLSKEFGVSPGLVQQAIYGLESEGLLAVQHGKGVRVLEKKSSESVAISFGFIQPYVEYMTFEGQIIHYAEKVFDRRNNFMIPKSSEGMASREREIVEHFVQNGVKGIILWPIDNDPNGEFFQNMSHRIPVVLVDRMVDGADLPSVVLDTHEAGCDVARHILGKLNCRRLLVLMDNLVISTNRDLIQGLSEQASEMGRMMDLTVMHLPITDFIQRLNVGDYSQVNMYIELVERQIREGGYDCIFCPQEEFLESVIIEPDMDKKFPELKLASMTGPMLTRSRKYNEFGVIRWVWDFPQMISSAADILQQWVLRRKRPTENVSIQIKQWQSTE
ncbi:MAG: GntR family transcriptional regulator [Phycisphaerae bacterium]|nr:GntR family transcriptional regulator [Phycisphaerae bacterium]